MCSIYSPNKFERIKINYIKTNINAKTVINNNAGLYKCKSVKK